MIEQKFMPSVLIAVNDLELRLLMEKTFKTSGIETWTVDNGQEAMKMALSLKPDAIVTELELPKLSGLDLCRELRQSYSNWTPVILISNYIDELDAVLGLELGADDYMVKPVRMKELVARIKSIIRRGSLCCNEPNQLVFEDDQPSPQLLSNGELSLNPDHFSVYMRNELVDFTRKEFELIAYLLKNKGKAFSRNHLLDVLSSDHPLDERIIDVFISRIRQKIEPNNRNPQYIKTVRNVGYIMKDIPTIAEKIK
ncbi:response regulator transcription factor [Salipaludibacillus sp. HK11]|uniref:response regulator transcription factor n=1 Tax=Salipaludibacillus sp. HK11 TaxID=3394320 RepID=UPI0039FD7E7C